MGEIRRMITFIIGPATFEDVMLDILTPLAWKVENP